MHGSEGSGLIARSYLQTVVAEQWRRVICCGRAAKFFTTLQATEGARESTPKTTYSRPTARWRRRTTQQYP